MTRAARCRGKLRQAHALLLAKGYGGRMEVASGYADVIRRVTSER